MIDEALFKAISDDIARAKKIASNMNVKFISEAENDVRGCHTEVQSLRSLMSIISALEFQLTLDSLTDVTRSLYKALLIIIGDSGSFTEHFEDSTIMFGLFTSMPTASSPFSLSTKVSKLSNSYSLNFGSGALGSDKFVGIKEPASEPIKTDWFNTALNKGTMGDSVFLESIVVGNSRFYFSRSIFIFDGSSTVLSLSHLDNATNTAFPYTFSYPLS